VDEEKALNETKRLLEIIRERIEYAIGRLKSFEEVKALAWRCCKCGHTKKFTRPVPMEVAVPCPKCRSAQFTAD
jgi:rubrerythrin